jgi:hypothetical protein
MGLNGRDLSYQLVRNISGAYSIAGISGIMAAGLGGAAEIWQFRWTSTTKLAFLRHIFFHAGVDTTGFTAGTFIINLFKATGFSIAGTGGNVLTMTGNNAKLDTNMATSAIGEIRISDTAALTAGTKTLLAHPHATTVTGVGTAAGADILANHDLVNVEDLSHPIILRANEGLIIQATVPATGTWKFAVESVWEEGETR